MERSTLCSIRLVASLVGMVAGILLALALTNGVAAAAGSEPTTPTSPHAILPGVPSTQAGRVTAQTTGGTPPTESPTSEATGTAAQMPGAPQPGGGTTPAPVSQTATSTGIAASPPEQGGERSPQTATLPPASPSSHGGTPQTNPVTPASRAAGTALTVQAWPNPHGSIPQTSASTSADAALPPSSQTNPVVVTASGSRDTTPLVRHGGTPQTNAVLPTASSGTSATRTQPTASAHGGTPQTNAVVMAARPATGSPSRHGGTPQTSSLLTNPVSLSPSCAATGPRGIAGDPPRRHGGTSQTTASARTAIAAPASLGSQGSPLLPVTVTGPDESLLANPLALTAIRAAASPSPHGGTFLTTPSALAASTAAASLGSHGGTLQTSPRLPDASVLLGSQGSSPLLTPSAIDPAGSLGSPEVAGLVPAGGGAAGPPRPGVLPSRGGIVLSSPAPTANDLGCAAGGDDLLFTGTGGGQTIAGGSLLDEANRRRWEAQPGTSPPHHGTPRWDGGRP